MGETRAGGVVDFDFAGSLELARRLYALAEELATQNRSRGDDALQAVREWRGRYGDEFLDRRRSENDSFRNVRSGLVDGAYAWAQAWATAMDQQNLNNRAARIESDAARLSEERSLAQKGLDLLNGDDSWDRAVNENPEPDPYPVPTEPGFLPTQPNRVY